MEMTDQVMAVLAREYVELRCAKPDDEDALREIEVKLCAARLNEMAAEPRSDDGSDTTLADAIAELREKLSWRSRNGKRMGIICLERRAALAVLQALVDRS
jgi:hypothetical protein